MTIVSQNLTLPGNVATGGTIQASDVSTLYAALNALNIPGTIGVFQQGFVDDNAYAVTASGSQDWTFTTAFNKAIFSMVPFSWTGSTQAPVITPRQSGATATTSTANLTFTNASSGEGLIVGMIGPRSTANTAPAFWLAMDDRTPGTLRNLHASTGGFSTSDMTSLGFTLQSTGALTVTFKSVRFWQEG
jgi:hypothetical protein